MTNKLSYEELEKENKVLKNKLAIASAWMDKEVKASVHNIAKRKLNKMTDSLRDSFLRENVEEMISNQITSYFGEILLMNAPTWTVKAITTAEINFYNMKKNPSIDGFSVVSWYHKALDQFIESMITKNFRKFAKKQWQTILRENDPLEKALHLVVNKKYILSTGRLYALIKMLKWNSIFYDYGRCFKNYLDKYPDLKNILLEDKFFNNYTELNKSEILSSKRHSWSITKQETELARKVLIWNFRDKDSILYKLLESQSFIY